MGSVKNIVITGCASGIGKCLTDLYLNEGAVVWGIDRDEATLNAQALDAKKYGKTLNPFVVDLVDSAALSSAAKEIFEKSHGIDIWVNNAGVSGLGDFMKGNTEQFSRVIQVNLNAVVLGTRLALEHMENIGKGKIVNMASVAGHVPCPYLSAYCASKFAVIGFTHALREELKLKEVPVQLVSVSPGFVDTGMIERGKAEGFPEWLSFLLSTPENVAKEIKDGLKAGKEDIYPTLNGKFLIGLGRAIPALTRRSSRLLLSKSIKDLFLFRKLPPN